MLDIHIPNNYIAERSYIIKTIIKDFLGIEYKLNISDYNNSYLILLPNKSTLTIKDHFFSNLDNHLGYLYYENIPEKVAVVYNEYIPERDIPIIFGEDIITTIKDKSDTPVEINCEIDVFASSFFMLTRWEEFVVKGRDFHSRFSYTDSLAYKFNFLDRPVVDEYTEMLFKMINVLDSTIRRKKNEFTVHITHDIDYISYKPKIREFVGDILKRRSPLSFAMRLWFGIFKNPYNTFDFLMDQSERIDVKSTFYIMVSGKHILDYEVYIYHRAFLRYLKRIKERGHSIGLHPSYLTYNDIGQLRKEKTELERVLGYKIYEGRQHYLRFDVPVTWQILDKLGFRYDSTIGYPERHGFRCGTCHEFHAFDILVRKELNLKEKPLLAMDVSFVGYQKYKPWETEKVMYKLIDIVKKYQGTIVLLWHNSSFNIYPWASYKKVYYNIITYLGNCLK